MIQTTASVLSTDAACQRFHDSTLAPEGWSTPRNDDDHRGQAARNQNLYAKRQYIAILNILYGEEVSLDDLEPYPSRDSPLSRLHSITTSVIETCARAESLGCLAKVSGVLLDLILENSLLGQCVAQTPIKFLKLAIKVGSTTLHSMASRHICADPKLSGRWFDCAAYYNANRDALEACLVTITGNGSTATEKLVEALLDVQLCRTHMVMSPSQSLTLTAPYGSHSQTIAGSCAECISRTHFAVWLTAELNNYAPNVSDTGLAESESPPETFKVVLELLQHFASSLMPFQIFPPRSNMHKVLAAEIGLPGDPVTEKAIKHHLDVCVKEAGAAIDEAFTMARTELTEENFPVLGIKKSRNSESVTLRQVSGETTSSETQRTVSTSSQLSQNSRSTEASSLGDFEPDEQVETKLDGGAHVFVAGEDSYLSCYTEESMVPELQTAKKQFRFAVSETSDDEQDPSSPEAIRRSLEKLFHKDPRWLELYVNIAESWEPTEEARLLSASFLDELKEPSDQRWSCDPNQFHRCCGEKKGANPREKHACGKATKQVNYYSQRARNGLPSSIW